MNIIVSKPNFSASSLESLMDVAQSEKGGDAFSEMIQQANVQQSDIPTSTPTQNSKNNSKVSNSDEPKADVEKTEKHIKKESKKHEKNISSDEQNILADAQLIIEKVANPSAQNASSMQKNTLKPNEDKSIIKPTAQINQVLLDGELADESVLSTIVKPITVLQNSVLPNVKTIPVDAKKMAADLSAANMLPSSELASKAIGTNLDDPKVFTQKATLPKLDEVKAPDKKLALATQNVVQSNTQNTQSEISKTPLKMNGADSAQFPQTLAAVQPNVIHAEEQENKTAKSFSQLGNVLQHQVTLAISNPASLLTTNPSAYNNSLDAATNNYSLAAKQLEAAMNPDTGIGTQLKQAYEANIKIYPPELGNVLAKLKVDKNSAQLTILTENDRVRDIVAASLPQLREHFQQGNLNLTHIEVQTSANSSTDQNMGKQQQPDKVEPDSQALESKTPVLSRKEPPKSPDTLVDTYV